MNPDFLVIGAGVAGLRAAIELAQAGSVLVVAKESLRESASEYAQGGIAVALSDDDEIELHEQDTIAAGDGLCNPAAVRTLVEEGPAVIQELIEWGAAFDRDGTRLAFTREAAHSRSRVLHAHGDSTGREIARTLYQKAASIPNVTFQSFARMTELPSGPRAVLLATGGLGALYLNTTNPDVATGDGVAMAYEAGAEISDIEFVQFHPTALAVAGAPRFLLSEALRGEGAVLRDIRGERFTDELAPRDVVSRAIVQEMQRSGSDHVLLDISQKGEEFVRRRFPRVFETCLRYGVNLGTAPAPVAPAAHYAMGGVRTDLDGRTSVPGLFAAGEVACTGVHGANRLASNSLLEGLVFGRRAGIAARECNSAWRGDEDKAEFQGVPERNLNLREQTAEVLKTLSPREEKIIRMRFGLEDGSEPKLEEVGQNFAVTRERIRQIEEKALRKLRHPSRSRLRASAPDSAAAILWTHCGIVRDGLTLHHACEIFEESGATVPFLIARCALAREESRGAHYRTDFPDKRPEFEKHSVIQKETGVDFY